MNSAIQKDKIRQQILQHRQHISPEQVKSDSKKVCNTLEKLEIFKKAKRVLFYFPVKNEIDTRPLIQKYLNSKEIFLPRVEKNYLLSLGKISSLESLNIGKFKIPQPGVDAPQTDVKELDLIIIPGIAFDKNGQRIGFGHGYYDTFLKSCRAIKIGLAYDFQIVDNISGQKHDEKMDLIITPSISIAPSHDL